MSLIVLIVAATTLVSGTYAWFLVGGFAELFDLGFDVVQASGGIEIQGSAGTAHMNEDTKSDTNWGSYLARDDFNANEILAADGKYAPVSSSAPGANTFFKTTFDGKYFQPDDPTATVGQHYNLLDMKIRATGEEAGKATMTIKMTAKDAANTSALASARVGVVYNGTTSIYGVAQSGLYALTSNPQPNTVEELGTPDSIIDTTEAGSGVSLAPVTLAEMTGDDTSGYTGQFTIENIPNDTNGAPISVYIWIEGNDPECTGERITPGSGLSVKIEFTGATVEG